jgi:hypothetical protein
MPRETLVSRIADPVTVGLVEALAVVFSAFELGGIAPDF